MLANRDLESEALQKLRLELRSEIRVVHAQSERLRADLTSYCKTQSAELRADVERLQSAQSAELRADLERIRAELSSSCRAHVAELRAEVTSSWRENESLFRDALAESQGKQEAELRRVKVLLQSFDKRVQEKATTPPRKAVSEQLLEGAAAAEILEQMQAIRDELEAERLSRNERLGELNERILGEIGDLRCLKGQNELLTQNFEAEKHIRKQEFSEIRATLDSVWSRVNVASSGGQQTRQSHYFQYASTGGEQEFKEVVGDPEDINSLYEMVREALGDTVYLKQQVSEDQTARSRDKQQLDQMSKELNLLRSLVKQATPSSQYREINE